MWYLTILTANYKGKIMKKIVSLLLVAIMGISLLAACGNDKPVTFEEKSGTMKTNVAYATTHESQVCDIYVPKRTTLVPVIVLVHGGGFLFGDQGMDVIQPVINKALAKGYAVVSIDYRKSKDAVFPAALADVKAAVRYVRSIAEEYDFDTNKIVIWGESAGAYLASMTALTPEVAELNGDVTDHSKYSSEVAALVDFYGPIEFYTLQAEADSLGMKASFDTESSFESKFLGQAISADKDATYKTYWETYKNSLPKNYELTAWVQVGNADARVPYTQSQNFADRLAGVIGEDNVKFGIIEGADHEDDLFYTSENLDAVFAYLDVALQ